MASSPRIPEQTNRVVVAFLDGRRLPGYIYNFSAMKDSFDLHSAENPLQGQATKIQMKDLKAVFFVREFQGKPEHKDKAEVDERAHGRKIEVTFRDGETILGKTEGYNPQKPGFFMFPGDGDSNNLRIYVINKNARRVRFA
jgi:uncharacterized protein DUF6982